MLSHNSTNDPGLSQSPAPSAGSTLVLKFGSSVFTHERESLSLVSEILRHVRRGRRVVAVVGSLWGATERLATQAKRVNVAPVGPALARLYATGEQAAAAMLSLALSNAGIDHAVVDARDAHFVAVGPSDDADPVSIDADVLRAALAATPVLIVPGAEAVDPKGQPAWLGRGGADLAAVFVANALGAEAHLIKDVDGLFEFAAAGPLGGGQALTGRYRSVAWSDVGAIGGRIVHPKAMRFAEAHRLAFRVRVLGSDGGTLISDRTEVERPVVGRVSSARSPAAMSA